MNMEYWAEHHQLLLWSIALVIGVLLAMKESVRAVVAAAPKGLRAVQIARIKVQIRSLEEYRRDKSTLLIEGFHQLAGICLYSSLYAIFSLNRYGYVSWKLNPQAEFAGPPEHLVVNIYIMLLTIIGLLMLTGLVGLSLY